MIKHFFKTKITVLLALMSISVSAQDNHGIILPDADELTVSGVLGEDLNDSYMRVVTPTDKYQKGETLVFRLPCTLDGYYFGPDAKRYKDCTISYSYPNVTIEQGTEMEDLEDFPANSYCYVVTDIPVDGIVSMIPGVATKIYCEVPSNESLASFGYFCMTEQELTERLNADCIQSVQNVESDDRMFDLMGREVNSEYKGIVIRNGRKEIRK